MRLLTRAAVLLLTLFSSAAAAQGVDPFAPVGRIPARATERAAEPEPRDRLPAPQGRTEPATATNAGPRPTLGVVVTTISREDAELFGISYIAGPRVIGVTPGSAAAAADIRSGDVILVLGSQEVADGNLLSRAVAERRIGETVTLRLMRDGRLLGASVTLAAAPDMAEAERLHTEARQHYFDVFGDRVRANNLFRAAAGLGHPAAMAHMGWIYSSGGKGEVKTNFAEALRWYEPAARAGNAQAIGGLCWMHYNGKGVARDFRAAFDWCMRGAIARDNGSLVTVGYMYDHGQGLDTDLVRARRFYTKAAEAGDGLAMLNLGVMHRDGRGVPVSKDEARRWFNKAKEVGMENAPTYLASLDAKPAQARRGSSGENRSSGRSNNSGGGTGRTCRPVNDQCQRCGGPNDPNNTCYTVACNFRMQCN